MRILTLAKTGLNKVRSHQKELRSGDLEDSIKSIPPGDWCRLRSADLVDDQLAFINSMVQEKFAPIQLLGSIKKNLDLSPENFITEKISAAYEKRLRFKSYEKGARIFYGLSDGLPGLIIDLYSNAAIIQINTAGLDRYRELIHKFTTEILSIKCFMLDNPKYREKESLPTFDLPKLPDLNVEENGLRYELRSEIIQKIGFYYDHRENRYQLMSFLKRLTKTPESALDLFCYAGAWGMSALQAGVTQADFIDQGDFSIEVQKALELNGFMNRGRFVRQDVFKFLDDCIKQNKKYDVVLSDPPAFAKSPLHKPQALDGYSKLHRKVFRIAAPAALCVFSSCTHYVSHEEFQKNIQDAANKENRRIQLLHCGMQGWDHPSASLDDRSNYIKSYFYLLES